MSKRPRPEPVSPPNVCMFGTGEYTTGFVGGGAADSDKGTGVVALVMLDLQRRGKVGRIGMCGVNGKKLPAIRKHMQRVLGDVYAGIEPSKVETWPADDELKSQYDCTNGASSLAIGGVEYPVRQDVSLDAALGNEQDWIGFQFGPDGRVDKVDFSACSGATGNQDKRLVLGLAGYEGGTRLTFVDSDKAMGVVVRVNGVSYAVDDLSSL